MRSHAVRRLFAALSRWKAIDVVLLLCAVSAAALHVGMHGVAFRGSIDDAWFLSFAHNYLVKGEERDLVFGGSIHTGMGGVQNFGKTAAHVFGAPLSLLGWTKSNGHLLSTLFVLGSAAIWYVLVRARHSRGVALSVALLMLLLDPFFSAAHMLRYEALILLLLSAALLLLQRGMLVASGLLCLVCFEVHPIGAIAGFYVVAFLVAGIDRRRPLAPQLWSPLPRLAIGAAIGVGYIVLLHGRHVLSFASVYESGKQLGDNVLHAYFFAEPRFRRLPELVLLLAGAGVFLRRRLHREDPRPLALLCAMVVFALVIRRGNPQYGVLFYPAFLYVVVVAFHAIGKLPLVLSAYLVISLATQGYRYAKNRRYDHEAYVERVRRAVPQDGLPVVGGPDDWFALMDRTFYSCSASAPRPATLDDFHFIASSDERTEAARARVLLGAELTHSHEGTLLDSFTTDQDTIEVIHFRRRPRAAALGP